MSYPGIGCVEVICGGMFAGKTEELLRRIRLAIYAKQKVVLFKPYIDNRYSEVDVVSHNRTRLAAINATTPEEIAEKAVGYDVIGIDEAHFLGSTLVGVCEKLADAGKRVIVAGLDRDYRGVPFEPMPTLLAMAEHVTKVHAICVICGQEASRTYRTSNDSARIVVGGSDTYEARCRKCFCK